MGHPTIPRILHFIWVGGPMPAKNQACLKSFKEKALGYECWLWIDTENLLAGTRRGAVMAMFKDDAGKLTGDWRAGPMLSQGDQATIKEQVGGSAVKLDQLRHDAYQSLKSFAEKNHFKLKFASEFGNSGKTAVSFMMGQYNREMTERGTNFGAASDILRILILRKYGGIYLDTDVECTENLPYITCPKDGALWSLVMPPGATMQKADWFDVGWWEKQYGAGNYPKICNSTIACHADSTALDSYRQVVEKNYRNVFDDDGAMDAYYSMANIRSQTIRITGPSAALEASGLIDIRKDVDSRASQVRAAVRKGFGQSKKSHLKTQDRKQFRYRAEEWFRIKDDMIFPAYLIEDKFFHQWL